MPPEQFITQKHIVQSIKGIVFDIDGTILRGEQLLPAVHGTLHALHAQQIKVCFLTNDNRKPIASWLSRLESHGISISADQMLTSAVIAAETVAKLCPSGTILLAGNEGLHDAFNQQNLNLINWNSRPPADAVVIGKDPNFDQKRLEIACQHIWRGAKFFVTNNDRKMPVADGYIPGTGAMAQAVAYATSTRPIVTGKPSNYAADILLNRLGVSADQAVIVGDSLTADIKLGKGAQMTTVLTLTGTHGRADANLLSASEQPDFIIENLSELIPALSGEKL